jgi:hypothetical protein
LKERRRVDAAKRVHTIGMDLRGREIPPGKARRRGFKLSNDRPGQETTWRGDEASDTGGGGLEQRGEVREKLKDQGFVQPVACGCL